MQPIGARIFLDVFRYIPVRCPPRNELKGCDGNTPKRDDIRMLPMLPHDSLLVELWDTFESGRRDERN